MEEEKIKKINEFGKLLYDVLWTEKSKNKKVLKQKILLNFSLNPIINFNEKKHLY